LGGLHPTLRHSPGRGLDVILQLDQRVASIAFTQSASSLGATSPPLSVIEESPLPIHEPMEGRRVCLQVEEVDAVVTDARRVTALEPVLLEYDAGCVHSSEEDPIDGEGYLRELDRRVSFTHDSAGFNLLNGALDHQVGGCNHLREAFEAEHFLHGAITIPRRSVNGRAG